MQRRHFLPLLLAAGTAPHAFAQSTSRRIVVPFPGGTSIDVRARVLAEGLRTTTGVSYIVDNRPGGSMIIGTNEVIKSPPDRRTLLLTVDGHVINGALNDTVKYNSLEDVTPITRITISPGFLILVSTKSNFKSLNDLISFAQKNPGKISYATYGPVTSLHLAAAIFERAANIKLLHVPYGGNFMTDLVADRVNMTFIAPTLALSYIRSGHIKALATTWHERIPQLPDVPTLTELGYPDTDLPAWSAIFGPPKMTEEDIQKTYAEIIKAIETPKFVENTVADSGIVDGKMAPEEFKNYLKLEIKRYANTFRPMGLTLS